jgi:hypothetical protein
VGLGGRSTLEAVSAALRVLGEPGAAAQLDVLFAEGVSLVTRLRGVPEAHASAASLRGSPEAEEEGRG